VLPPLSLYVHLPWCERKCPYCDFNSHESTTLPEDAYVDALLGDLGDELRSGAHLEARRIETVFIGGGTPSLFSVDAMERLLRGLRERCDLAPGAEITMEANPGSVERERLAGYVSAGITRLSLGVQSFNDRSLQALGRVHDSGDARRAIAAARAAGARSFNLDLMHGLPGQARDEGLADIEEAVAARAPHLSWYQLTIEANTRFYSDPPLLPAEDELADLETRGARRLEAAGYRRYEVSAWAQPGEECRHNLNYWCFGDYVAIGAGAHGKITDAEGTISRYRKTRRPEDSLAAGGTARRDLKTLDAADRCGEFMMNALRLAEGFDTALYEERTGLAPATIADTVAQLEEQELLARDGSRLRATALGWRFLDDVVGRFFDLPADQLSRR
jgi:oxygen-independent coproporphyrinogen-3 oxidase